MTETDSRARRAACAACRIGPALSGCMSSPTYGTDKTANDSLPTDCRAAFLVRAEARSPDRLQAASRTGEAAPGQKALPPPQDSIARPQAPIGPNRPSSAAPACAPTPTANSDDPSYQPQIVDDVQLATEPLVKKAMADSGVEPSAGWQPGRTRTRLAPREEFQRRLAESKQGNPTTRKYLSEPPLDISCRLPRRRRRTNSARTSTRRSAASRRRRARRAAAGATGCRLVRPQPVWPEGD